MGRPSRSTIRPSIGISSRTSLRVTPSADPMARSSVHAGPYPSANAESTGTAVQPAARQSRESLPFDDERESTVTTGPRGDRRRSELSGRRIAQFRVEEELRSGDRQAGGIEDAAVDGVEHPRDGRHPRLGLVAQVGSRNFRSGRLGAPLRARRGPPRPRSTGRSRTQNYRRDAAGIGRHILLGSWSCSLGLAGWLRPSTDRGPAPQGIRIPSMDWPVPTTSPLLLVIIASVTWGEIEDLKR